MFGSSSKPVVLSYGSRRRRAWRPPGWVLWLLFGIAAGAGGLWMLQEEYLPPRLSAEASNELRSAYEQADAERKNLKMQLASTTQQLEAAKATAQRQSDELAAPRAAAQKLGDDMAALIAALPPDPRGGAAELRPARFVAQGNALAYEVVLTRDAAASPLAGVMQLNVLGLTARGAETSVALKPVDISVGGHALVRGSLTLPDGVRPRQVTVQVQDAPGGKTLGMRVMTVR